MIPEEVKADYAEKLSDPESVEFEIRKMLLENEEVKGALEKRFSVKTLVE